MRSIWIGLAAASASLLAFAALEPRARLERLETEERVDPTEVTALRGELSRLRAYVEAADAALRERIEDEPRAERAEARVLALERELELARCALEEQRERLALLEIERDFAPFALEERLASATDAALVRIDAARASADEARDLAASARASADAAVSELARDEQRMWSELLGPTVQISGDETVGSGILLASEPTSVAGEHETYALTAWHVIRDLQRDGEVAAMIVPVSVYSQDGEFEVVSSHVVRHDAKLDVALLRLESTRAFPFGAKLARRERLESVRIFDRVYAVGCPLGNDPIPTFGEVADVHHDVDGQTYWMVSAPTYIGNSGGGVFDARTLEVVGLFTKIYTHGALRPSVVPHMGLAMPLADVYDWLEDVGFASLAPRADAAAPTTAASVR